MRREGKVVWILGAGFSKSLGGPLLPELLSGPATHKVAKAYPQAFPEDDHVPGLVSRLYEAGSSRSTDCVERQWDDAEGFLERLDLAVMADDKLEIENLIAFFVRLQYIWMDRANHKREDHFRKPANLLAKLSDADGLITIRAMALKLVCAECSVFLEAANPLHERWIPYVNWAVNLGGNDTVITFNYDCVPEFLAQEANRIWVPDPCEVDEPRHVYENCATVLKLHGSLCWQTRDGVIGKIRPTPKEQPGPNEFKAAITMSPDELAIAVPGPSKRKAVEGKGPLAGLWKEAERRILEAATIVFMGYRIPPSDAYSRHWLIEQINAAVTARRDSGSDLVACTVLGADVQHADSVRLKGLLRTTGAAVARQPFYAEDFLDVIATTGTWFSDTP